MWELPAIRQTMRELTIIWAVALVLMSVSCGVNPALGITKQSTAEAIVVNWIIPIAIMAGAGFFQNWWTERAKQGEGGRPSGDTALMVPASATPTAGGDGEGGYGATTPVVQLETADL
jgi:hypothetical protein